MANVDTTHPNWKNQPSQSPQINWSRHARASSSPSWAYRKGQSMNRSMWMTFDSWRPLSVARWQNVLLMITNHNHKWLGLTSSHTSSTFEALTSWPPFPTWTTDTTDSTLISSTQPGMVPYTHGGTTWQSPNVQIPRASSSFSMVLTMLDKFWNLMWGTWPIGWWWLVTNLYKRWGGVAFDSDLNEWIRSHLETIIDR